MKLKEIWANDRRVLMTTYYVDMVVFIILFPLTESKIYFLPLFLGALCRILASVVRPLDTQADKVYAAEDQLKVDAHLDSLESIGFFMQDVLQAAHVTQNYGVHEVRVEWGPDDVEYDAAIGRRPPSRAPILLIRRASFLDANDEVKVPHWLILHELAHVFTSKRFPAHGKEFCGVYLDLVAHFCGQKIADVLEFQFALWGVEFLRIKTHKESSIKALKRKVKGFYLPALMENTFYTKLL